MAGRAPLRHRGGEASPAADGAFGLGLGNGMGLGRAAARPASGLVIVFRWLWASPTCHYPQARGPHGGPVLICNKYELYSRMIISFQRAHLASTGASSVHEVITKKEGTGNWEAEISSNPAT